PHTRGDGPLNDFVRFDRLEFSPHAWGWSAERGFFEALRGVFPTRVGMVRARPVTGWALHRFSTHVARKFRSFFMKKSSPALGFAPIGIGPEFRRIFVIWKLKKSSNSGCCCS